MALLPLDLPPGVVRRGTGYQQRGRYRDAAFMRWRLGTLGPFGGWVKASPASLGGPARNLLAWRPSLFSRRAAIGVPNGLQFFDGDQIRNITPVGFPAGVVDSFRGMGYGAGPYGAGPYGGGVLSPLTQATWWALDNWGDFLIALASHDRVLYEWTGDPLVPAAPIANAPSAVSAFVTDERVLVALGAGGDLRNVAWSAQENNSDWTPTPSNFAGDFRLQTSGTLVRGARVQGANLLWTTTDVHFMRFIGLPFVYSFERISDSAGLASPGSVQLFDGKAIWLGNGQFFFYEGGQVSALPSELNDFVFGDINWEQANKFSSGYLSSTSEYLFWYASAGSKALDRCVSFNVSEGHWNTVDQTGIMARGGWADRGAFADPVAAGQDGFVYFHERGWSADGSTLVGTRFAETGPIELGRGDRLLEANELLPDERTEGQVQFRFAQQFTPTGPVFDRGPFLAQPYTPIRLTGRQVALRVEATQDADFRVGTLRLNVTPGGQR